MKFTKKELNNLKNSITDLETTIGNIYSSREVRPLTGENSILTRTLGNNFIDISNYENTYMDKKRNKKAQTELSEVIESMQIYDSNPSRKNQIDFLLEVGDIVVQDIILNKYHSQNINYTSVKEKFKNVLNYTHDELKSRDLSLNEVNQLTKIKYGARQWLTENGYKGKNKELEQKLCLEYYD